MLVLGLNAFHADSAAALFRDGQLVAAVAEERLNRIKHFSGLPVLAVQQVLSDAGATLADVDAVAIARDSLANLRSRLAYVVKNLRKTSKLAPGRLNDRASLRDVEGLLCDACNLPREAFKAKIHRVEHHLAHAASSFLVSPFERAAVLTIDGFGDFASALWGLGEGSNIKVLGRVTYPHSLGILYTAVCQFIGFDRYGDEGKVMGLAPYGQPSFAPAMQRLLQLTPDGYELGLRYFCHHTVGVETGAAEDGSPQIGPLFTQALSDEFGPPRVRGSEITQRDMDIAASLQQRLEQAVIHLANMLHKRTGETRLCLAGGVALNGVANGKLLEHTPFREIYIQPAAGDDGTAIGAAAWVNARTGLKRFVMQHAAWGPSFTDSEIDAALHDAGDELDVRTLSDADIAAQAAAIIAEGGIVGWFQGGSEWGPRALGQRSILAHPGHPRMKAILNARIKQREPFRPFAPAIKAERLSDYFESAHPSPFMLMVYRTRPEKYAKLCAVDHHDHTGRVQTVDRGVNPRYWGVIDAFEKLTGTPVLLNTSFNENEPIVNTPAEAIDCFQRTNMDALVIGNRLVVKAAVAARETQTQAGQT